MRLMRFLFGKDSRLGRLVRCSCSSRNGEERLSMTTKMNYGKPALPTLNLMKVSAAPNVLLIEYSPLDKNESSFSADEFIRCSYPATAVHSLDLAPPIARDFFSTCSHDETSGNSRYKKSQGEPFLTSLSPAPETLVALSRANFPHQLQWFHH